MNDLFGASIVDILETFHGVIDFVLFVALLMGGIFTYFVSVQNWKHINVAGITASASYLLTYLFGLLIYPVFRVDVRDAILDPNFPQATGLFEIKEHIASIGAFVAVALLLLGVFGKMRQASSARKQVYGGLFAILAILSVSLIVLGFSFTSFY